MTSVVGEKHILYFKDEKGNLVHFDYPRTYKSVASSPDKQKLRLPTDHSGWNTDFWVSEFQPIGGVGANEEYENNFIYPKSRQITDDVTLFMLHTYSTNNETSESQELWMPGLYADPIDWSDTETPQTPCFCDTAFPTTPYFGPAGNCGAYPDVYDYEHDYGPLYEEWAQDSIEADLTKMGCAGYVVRYADGRQFHFDADGRIIYFDTVVSH